MSSIGNHGPGHMHARKGSRNFMTGAVKHPGVEIARAKANGISTHEQLERDAKSSNPTLRRRGNLGLTFERMASRRKRG